MTCFPNETHDYVYLVKICRRRMLIGNIYSYAFSLFFFLSFDKNYIYFEIFFFFLNLTCFPNETHDYVYLVKICRRRIMISNIYTRFRYLFFCSAREKVVLATSVSRFFSLLDPKGLHFSQFANKIYIFSIRFDC